MRGVAPLHLDGGGARRSAGPQGARAPPRRVGGEAGRESCPARGRPGSRGDRGVAQRGWRGKSGPSGYGAPRPFRPRATRARRRRSNFAHGAGESRLRRPARREFRGAKWESKGQLAASRQRRRSAPSASTRVHMGPCMCQIQRACTSRGHALTARRGCARAGAAVRATTFQCRMRGRVSWACASAAALGRDEITRTASRGGPAAAAVCAAVARSWT